MNARHEAEGLKYGLAETAKALGNIGIFEVRPRAEEPAALPAGCGRKSFIDSAGISRRTESSSSVSRSSAGFSNDSTSATNRKG
jgi:hypothetical protein